VFFKDATVSRAPTLDEVEAAAAKVPGMTIILQVREGMRLSDLPEQDSYQLRGGLYLDGCKQTIVAAVELRTGEQKS
jgi:hypothetical protein